MKQRKGELTGQSVASIIFWIVFFALALGAIFFLIRRLAS
jgi:hypothetical protein